MVDIDVSVMVQLIKQMVKIGVLCPFNVMLFIKKEA